MNGGHRISFPVARGRAGAACWLSLPVLLIPALLLMTAGTARAEVTLESTAQKVVLMEGGPGGRTEMLEDVATVQSGDVVRYSIVFENTSPGDVAAGSVVITNPLPEGTEYIEGSAVGEQTVITFSLDGETFADPGSLMVGEEPDRRPAAASEYRAIRWRYEPELATGESGRVSFDVRIR